jgi:hypothetical protein
MPLLREGVRIGPYIVECPLPQGRGGFSEVVMARKAHPGSEGLHVAIKIASPLARAMGGASPTQQLEMAQRSLMNEVETLRSLRHPGVVRIYPMLSDERRVSFCARAAEIDGHPWYFAMEYLAGGSIENLAERRGPLPVGLAVEIAQQVAEALDYIHAKGFAHLDIKTSNILLREPLDQRVPQAVLIDFGAAQRPLRRAEIDQGSLVYLSPERVRVMRGDDPPEAFTNKAAADVYALGVVLYRMLAGRAPFSGRPDYITTAILSAAPTHPSEHNRELIQYPELDRLVDRVLDKQPSQRPTAGEVIALLDRIIPRPRPFGDEVALRALLDHALVGRWRRATVALCVVAVLELGGISYLGLAQAGLIALGHPRPQMIQEPVDGKEDARGAATTSTARPTRTATSIPVRASSTIRVSATATGTRTIGVTATPEPTSTRVPTLTPIPTRTPAPTSAPTQPEPADKE